MKEDDHKKRRQSLDQSDGSKVKKRRDILA